MDTPEHGHVGLRARDSPDGSPFIEMVPARRRDDGSYEVLGTPGIVDGCAEGDFIAVDPDGNFVVVSRGGNVAIHLWPGPREFTEDDIRSLKSGFRDLGGRVEAPERARFVVVTVPVAVGFPTIEAVVKDWVGRRKGVEWYFGNVYDERGRPLDWWADGAWGGSSISRTGQAT